MADIEKVIKEFELYVKEFKPCCATDDVELDMLKAVLELLKEQKKEIDFFTKMFNAQIRKWPYVFGNCKNVVFCKDCVHGEMVNDVVLCGRPGMFGSSHRPDFFCADGEGK